MAAAATALTLGRLVAAAAEARLPPALARIEVQPGAAGAAPPLHLRVSDGDLAPAGAAGGGRLLLHDVVDAFVAQYQLPPAAAGAILAHPALTELAGSAAGRSDPFGQQPVIVTLTSQQQRPPPVVQQQRQVRRKKKGKRRYTSLQFGGKGSKMQMHCEGGCREKRTKDGALVYGT